MGLCGSAELSQAEKDAMSKQKQRSKDLDGKMAEDHVAEQAINKLLLLGAGESGKSTLFKQMVRIYGKGYSDQDRASYIPIVFNNTIQAIKTLSEQSVHFGGVRTAPGREAKAVIDALRGDEVIDAAMAGYIRVLWQDPGIQSTYDRKSSYQITDSCKYFMERVSEYCKEGFMPTEQDIFRTRVRTTGIVEMNFEIDGNQFKMFDVGGQRNERKKWIHCFENVTAVLFVAAASGYDQVLYEDEKTNRMVEALNLFEEICNSRWFRETAIILFLNKRDIFLEKCTKVSLRVCFADYDGDDSYERGIEFIIQKFETRNKNPDKQIYTHVTCATDTDNISKVFNAVKDIIIRRSLNEAGLV
jgi:GTPase SAR1 family protein